MFAKMKNKQENMKDYINSCREIVKNQGACEIVECKKCPFNDTNDVYNSKCFLNGYVSEGKNSYDRDPLLKRNAKDFIKKFDLQRQMSLYEQLESKIIKRTQLWKETEKLDDEIEILENEALREVSGDENTTKKFFCFPWIIINYRQ